MTGSLTAALRFVAAICGLIVAPALAAAQLRCPDDGSGIQIRTVSFAGNETFSDSELALHVVSTESDFFARYLDKRIIPVGAAVGAGLGVYLGARGKKARGGLIFGGVGAGVAAVFTTVSGNSRCIRPGTLAGDILNLGGFYRDQGFIDVRVDTSSVLDGQWVDVLFTVTEGKPVLVDSLTITGFDTTTMGQLPLRMRSTKGSRYSPTLTQEDVDTLQTRMRNTGYPEGVALRAVSFPDSQYGAHVVFDVRPGPRARIGRVTVNRNTLQGRDPSVDEAVVRRLLRFGEGEIYSERALFESERRFYRTGTFLSAEIAPDLSHVVGDSLVDVVVNVTEDLTHSYTIEPGFGTLDCLRMRTEYTDKAFLNGVNRLDVSGSVSKIGLANRWNGVYDACRSLQGNPSTDISSSAVNYNATVRVTRPLPLPGGLLPSASIYTERRGAYQAYLRTTLVGGALSVSKNITRTVLFEGSYNLEFGHTDAAETVLCFIFRACDESSRAQLTQGDKRLAVLGARFSRDRRNFVDSASAGAFARIDLRSAQTWTGSDRSLRFVKGVVDAGFYQRFLAANVIAVRLRAGLVGGGQVTNGARLPPPQERLYAGGETSVRGFRQNELGPVIFITSDSAGAEAALAAGDDATRLQRLRELSDLRVIPAGGNAMYVGNLEYRIPGPFLRTLQTILFLDVGTVSTQGGLAPIVGSEQFRWTPGIAFKYFSPVGAVQINLGYNSYDQLPGPVFTDRVQERTLTCISGLTAGNACQSLSPTAPRAQGLRRITFTVAFPPDF